MEKPRDDVKVGGSPVRCPYCHEGVQPGDPKLVACGGCLARHHDACWDERGACSTCGGVRRLVADERQGPSDAELVELVRTGERARALAALRGRGLDERAAGVALDLVAAALAPLPATRIPWLMTAIVFATQGLALFGSGALALVAEAEVGAFTGLAVMIVAAVALASVAVVVARGLTRWALGGLATLNLLATWLGPAVVIGANVGANDESPELLILGLVLGLVSLIVGATCWPRRQPLAGAGSRLDGAGGDAGSRRP